MSVNYTNSRSSLGCVYPLYASDAGANFNRYEPLITPTVLRTDFLFGINLTSPITKQTLNDNDLKRALDRATNRAELLIKINIAPVQRKIRKEFDRNMYVNFGSLEMPFRPILSVDELAIVDSADPPQNVFVFPPNIIETGNFQTGLITFGTVTSSYQYGTYTNTFYNGTTLFTSFLANSFGLNWIPAFFTVTCTTGFPAEKTPGILNDLIGTIAAIDILSMLGPLFRIQSQSLGIDGLSQAQSGPGPNIYLARIADLEKRKNQLIADIKMIYYNSIFVSTV